MAYNKSLFNEGDNCWAISQAAHATMLVDCANFYRAIHSAIAKAKHSIFIVGWDIDSRIRLLRGEDEENSDLPSRAGELLAYKAQQNPDLQIYLLRWDYSITFLKARETLAARTWEFKTPPNVHVWLDNTIPIGGSHHQKIILVDDEIAFTGGMDIAPQRWDEREHRAFDPERNDPLGPYEPYHDIQIVVDGPVVMDLCRLARQRWKEATGYDALPIRDVPRFRNDLPAAWPDGFDPFFENINCALSCTDPRPEKPLYQVEKMYLDLIESAEKFIYIENQFLARESLAHALNRRLKQNSSLKVLIASSYNPQGIMECEGMWAGRINFKRILEEGIGRDRVRMVYPLVYDEQKRMHPVRIHSKIFAVDDRYLTVASSNLNNRSMRLDTECDFVMEANAPEERRKIADARNDLIAEHTGRSKEEIEKIINEGKPLDRLLECVDGNCYAMREIDDTIFTNQNFAKVARYLSDPAQPLVGSRLRNPRKHWLFALLLLLALMAGGYYMLADHLDFMTPENIGAFLEKARGTPWAFPLVCLVFVAGGFLFFPVMALNLATVIVFGPILGPLYALTGAMLNAAALFWVGRGLGVKWLRKLFGESVRLLDNRVRESGVTGMVLIRLLPIAPYTAVNVASGISSIRFNDYIAGTFLGMLPGVLAKAILGDSIVKLFMNPSPDQIGYLLLGIAIWIGMIYGSHRLAKYLQKKKEAQTHATPAHSDI